MKSPVLQRFIEALGSLTEHDLYELAAMLRNPTQRNAAISVITSIAAFKRTNLLTARTSKAVSESKSSPATNDLSLSNEENYNDDLKTAVFSILRDASAFPKTSDVIEELGRILGNGFLKSIHPKLGRNQIINHAWTLLRDMPLNEREQKLRDICEHYKTHNNSDDYKELFKILSRSE